MADTNRLKIAIVDIDGTLANVEHRLHFILDKKPKDWEGFFSETSRDTLNEWCLDFIHTLINRGIKIVLLTGRPKRSKEVTEAWLRKYQVPYHALFMRNDGNFMDDVSYKKRALNKKILGQDLFGTGQLFELDDIAIAVDDRDGILQMFKEHKIKTLDAKEAPVLLPNYIIFYGTKLDKLEKVK